MERVLRKDLVTTKELLAKDVMLTYPYFSIFFVLHTDASDLQLGSVIFQEKRPNLTTVEN